MIVLLGSVSPPLSVRTYHRCWVPFVAACCAPLVENGNEERPSSCAPPHSPRPASVPPLPVVTTNIFWSYIIQNTTHNERTEEPRFGSLLFLASAFVVTNPFILAHNKFESWKVKEQTCNKCFYGVLDEDCSCKDDVLESDVGMLRQ